MSAVYSESETPPTVLVPDDNPDMMDILTRFLSKAGMVALPAYDGHQCLERVSQGAVDVIVLDVMMPKMDGYTFLRKLKQVNDLKIPPVIMLTAKDQMQATFKMEGVADYFVKPLDTEKFLKRVKELVPPVEL